MCIRDRDDSVVRFGHLVNAVPGSVAGLLKAHQDHGTMPLADLLMPAIRLARDGFEVTHDLNYVLEWGKESMLSNEASNDKFYNANKDTIEIKSTFKQPSLAKNMCMISKKGADVYYRGEIAKLISEESLVN